MKPHCANCFAPIVIRRDQPKWKMGDTCRIGTGCYPPNRELVFKRAYDAAMRDGNSERATEIRYGLAAFRRLAVA